MLEDDCPQALAVMNDASVINASFFILVYLFKSFDNCSTFSSYDLDEVDTSR